MIEAGTIPAGWDLSLGTTTFTDDTIFLTVIPEPSTFALAALGLLGLVGTRRRRNRA